MLLTATLAWATTNAASFTTDSGDWVGGSTSDGVLRVTDGSASLTATGLESFTLDARIRLTDGSSITARTGDAALVATWGAGGSLELGESSAALPAADQAWNAISTGLTGAEPELAILDGTRFLYRSVDESVEAATSSDGIIWVDQGFVATGTSPDAVVDGDRVVLYSSCGTSICRVESSDGLGFSAPVAILEGALTAVARGSDGVWWMWYTDSSGAELASSSDGVSFDLYSPLLDDGRLHALDVRGGYDGAWDAFDGLHLSHDSDPLFADTASDTGPLAFGCDLPTDPSIAVDGTTWYLAADCDGEPSVAIGTPTAGSWVDLHLEWDGATLTASWGSADPLFVDLVAADSFAFEANGTLELDEVVVVYTSSGGDTAGDSDTDSAEDTSGETGEDTADDSNSDEDSADSAGPFYSGADLTGEPGGCGCAARAPDPALLLIALGGLAFLSRRAGGRGPT